MAEKSGKKPKVPWDQAEALKRLDRFQHAVRFGSKGHIRELQSHVVELHKQVMENRKLISEDSIRQKVEKIHEKKLAEFSQALNHANRLLKELTEAAEEAKAEGVKTFTRERRAAAVRD